MNLVTLPVRTHGLDVVINFVELGDGLSRLSHQRFKDGALVAWQYGRANDAELTVSMPSHLAMPVGLGSVTTSDAFQHVRLSAAGANDCLLPPLDVPGNKGMQMVPGASLSIAYEVSGAPLGSFRVHERFLDGQLVGYETGDWPADLTVRVSYLTLVGLRMGRLPLLKALRRAQLIGPAPFVNLAGAMVEDASYRRHVGQHSRLLDAVYRWTTNVASPGWVEARRTIWNLTNAHRPGR